MDGGDPFPTFHQACLARGLLEDDNEWRQCLQEAAHMASGHQLRVRNLFVTILLHLIPWRYGWSLESLFVMTFDMLSTQKTSFTTLPMIGLKTA